MTSRVACFIAPFVFVFCILVPEQNLSVRVLTILSFLSAIIGWLIRLRKKRIVGALLLSFVTIIALLFFLPSKREHRGDALAVRYIARLQHYEGVRYWWGGETCFGLDCSGLIRRAMMDACWLHGLRHFDGGLLSTALSMWWHDASAQALGEGYRNLTMPVTRAKSLNELDHSLIRAGDLAVLGDGSHIMAYLGDKRWIEADPGAEKVIIETVPSKNMWFTGSAKIVRWKLLAPAM